MMTNISKIMLLSISCIFCYETGNVYASLISGIVPKSGTHIDTPQHHQSDCPHLSHLRLAAESSPRLAPFIESAMLTSCLPEESNRHIRVASVCFITDTGECSGEKFGNSEDISGGNGGTPDYGSPQDLCRDAGFVNTPCPEGATPDSYCPYDASFHSKCACSADYNKTCDTAAGQKGVGSSCGGKYKECCNICDGYTYTSVPSGYVSAGECSSCDGKKYKVKCDPNAYVNGSVCGAQGGSGGSCSDDSGTHYKKCNCPNNYEWNAGQKKCVCATSFKYACNGTGYAGGEGNSCDGKFGKCRCASGYTWDAASGACVCSGTDWCALNQNCRALGYAQQSCEGAAVKCPFDTSYVYCL